MKKILIVAHNIRFIVQFELNDIKLLQNMGYEVHCAANYKEDHVIGNALEIMESANVKVHQIDCDRSPFRLMKNAKALRQLVRLLRAEKYDGVHCHTPMGGVLARLAASRAGVKPVLYTAHGFHFFKGAPLINWLVYFPVEWLCSFMTDTLITINQEDYLFAKKYMHAKTVECIPGVGIDLEKICPGKAEDVQKSNELREKLGLPENAKMLLSVGEVNDNKNHRIVMEAMAKLHDLNLYYVICGRGPLEQEHLARCCELNIQDRVILAGYQENIVNFYRAADVSLFPSKREGLGLAAVEGMACGTPLIASDTRGSREYCVNGENSIVCQWQDVDAFVKAIASMASDDALRKKIGANGIETAKRFDVNVVKKKMQTIYQNAFGLTFDPDASCS